MVRRRPMNTPNQWNPIAAQARRAAGSRCERCHLAEGTPDASGTPARLIVHHRSKHRQGRKPFIVLCPACHRQAERGRRDR